MEKENNKWDELDGAAKVNLEPHDLDEFYRYKAELRTRHTWEDAHCILSGFIWDCLDGYGWVEYLREHLEEG